MTTRLTGSITFARWSRWTPYNSVNSRPIVGSDEFLEFLNRVLAEMAAIDHEQSHAGGRRRT